MRKRWNRFLVMKADLNCTMRKYEDGEKIDLNNLDQRFGYEKKSMSCNTMALQFPGFKSDRKRVRIYENCCGKEKT